MSEYAAFLADKAIVAPTGGVTVDDSEINPILFPFQRDLVRWSLRKGRAALFADTGLGKTFMQLEWARLTGQRTLILAPLAVARQTVAEGARLGIRVTYARKQADAPETGLTITNYEMLPHFDPSAFGAVVLDESSILKSFEGKTRTMLIEAFVDTPYRLACTATPAPNDIAEMANHAEFLGIMSRTGMLATFFVHDDEGWRLKRHARQPFYRWLASWGMSLKRPSDLGYSDEGYNLPPLTIDRATVQTGYVPEGMLFATTLKGIGHRTKVRKETLTERVQLAAEMINASDEPWIAWCGLNEEAAMLAELTGGTNVEGSQSPEEKAKRIGAFVAGDYRVMVTKPSLAAFGLNLQHCARMVFVGLSDSYEAYYQAIRRCYRYGQTKPVTATIILSDLEEPIYQNVIRKEQEAKTMSDELVKHVAQFEREEIAKAETGQFEYREDIATGDGWEIRLGDSCERIAELADESVDLSVFSPPFQSLYVYSATERDLGNSSSRPEFWEHFGFIIDGLLRVMKPGRNVAVHVQQIATTLGHQGFIGLEDFRGDTIRRFIDHGFIYHGEVCIDKDPQAQAIRTHSKALLFVQLRKDASWLRPGLADYILVFRKPGDNAVPVQPDITNDDWIEWARPIWYGIRESDTLNAAEGRGNDDERHIAPLQLGTIERCVRLWSNPGELVFSPFTGIGSEGYQSILSGRRFTGCELKPSYWSTAVKNLKRAEAERERLNHPSDLFTLQEVTS